MSAVFPAFTPGASLLGGFMLSTAVNGLLVLTGSVFGISGFFHRSVNLVSIMKRSDSKADRGKNLVALGVTIGLLLGGGLLNHFRPSIESGLSLRLFDDLTRSNQTSSLSAGSAGFLVGLGTLLGSGCTSGHFLCGLSRLSLRSITATGVFFSTAVLTRTLGASGVNGEFIEQTSPSQQWNINLVLALQAPAVVLGLLASVAHQIKGPRLHNFLTFIASLTCGAYFAFGLGLAGMLRPSKVLGFLDIGPSAIEKGLWDPSLAMVAVGGILPAAAFYWGYVRRQTPSASPLISETCIHYQIPPSWPVTARLVLGALIFGIGWGILGFCPGPVLVNLGTGRDTAQYSAFTAAMGLGGLLGSSI